MKKNILYIFGIGLLFFLAGCSSSIKDGTYYGYEDSIGKMKLTIKDKKDVSIDFIDQNNAIEKSNNSIWNLGNTKEKIIATGTIDTKDKKMTIAQPQKSTFSYKIIKGGFDLDMDGQTISFYEADSDEAKKIIAKEDKDVSDMLQADQESESSSSYESMTSSSSESIYAKQVREREASEAAANSSDTSSSSSTNSSAYTDKELDVAVKKIQDDFFKQLSGTWLPKVSGSNGDESTLAFHDDHTFDLTVKFGFSHTDVNVKGKLEFAETTDIKDKLIELINGQKISSLDEVATYQQYGNLISHFNYGADFECKWTLTYSGMIRNKEVNATDEQKLANIRLGMDNRLYMDGLFNALNISTVPIPYYTK